MTDQEIKVKVVECIEQYFEEINAPKNYTHLWTLIKSDITQWIGAHLKINE